MTDDSSHDLPRPRYGFSRILMDEGSSLTDQRTLQSDNLHSTDVDESEPVLFGELGSISIETSDLPRGIRDIENPLATVHPHLSQFFLYVDPSNEEHMRFFQAFALAEEMMHGRRHRFGLTRSHHLATYRYLKAFFEYLDGEREIDSAAEIMFDFRYLAHRIDTVCHSLLETVDSYLCQSVMGESGYLDRHVEGYLKENPDVDRETAKQRFERVRDTFRYSAKREDAALYERLNALEAQYDRVIAETVADTVLDIPYLIEPLTQEGYDSIPPSDLALRDRFDQTVEVLEELSVEDSDEVDSDELRRDLEARIDDRLEANNETRHPRDLEMPLLDVPQRVGSEETTQNRYDAIMEAPTAIGRVVNAAFRFQGNFGGVIYRFPTQDGSLHNNWFVNPLIEDEPVGPTAGYAPLRGAETYGELWEWVYMGENILNLLGENIQGTDKKISCPMCAISVDDNKCAGSQCAYSSVVERVNENRHELQDAMEREQRARFGES